MSKVRNPVCAKCPTTVCHPLIRANEKPPIEKAPEFCPMINMTSVMKTAVSEYDKPEVREFARKASLQEFECYENTPEGLRTRNPRILELIEFAKKCGYNKLGLAFCIGLMTEARVLTSILENKDFEVISVCCKTGSVPKERIGIKPDQKITGADRWETMCNPIMQAEILNAANVEFAVLLGLCIGHDTLFIKYCRVPVTVIAVKDRVTGHNPLAALYTVNSYYARLRSKIG